MPALTPGVNNVATQAEEFTYTSAANETLRIWTQNCRVQVFRVLIAGDWEDDQTSKGHTEEEVFTFPSSAGAAWKLVAYPHFEDDQLTQKANPRIFVELF